MWNRVRSRRNRRRFGNNDDSNSSGGRQTTSTSTSNATTETETGKELAGEHSTKEVSASVAATQWKVTEGEHDIQDQDGDRDIDTDCQVGQHSTTRSAYTHSPVTVTTTVTITKHDTKKERRQKYNQWFVQNYCTMKVSQGDVITVERNRNRDDDSDGDGDGDNNKDDDDDSYGDDYGDGEEEEDTYERRRLVIPRLSIPASSEQSLVSRNRHLPPFPASSSSARALTMITEQQQLEESDEKTEREEDEDEDVDDDEKEEDDEDVEGDGQDDEHVEEEEDNGESGDNTVDSDNGVVMENKTGTRNDGIDDSVANMNVIQAESTIGSSLEETDSSKPTTQHQQRHQHHSPSCHGRCSSSTTTASFSVPDRCLICLESYHVGDSVVWSSNTECDHVFHRHCLIKYFDKLQRRRGETPCPCCRQSYCPTLQIEVRAKKRNSGRRRSRSSVLSFQQFVWTTLSSTGTNSRNSRNDYDNDNDSCVDNQFDENRTGVNNPLPHQPRRQPPFSLSSPSPTMIMSSLRRSMMQQQSSLFRMMRFTDNTTTMRPPRSIQSVPVNV